MNQTQNSNVSVSAGAQKLVDQLVNDAASLRCVVSTGEVGEKQVIAAPIHLAAWRPDVAWAKSVLADLARCRLPINRDWSAGHSASSCTPARDGPLAANTLDGQFTMKHQASLHSIWSRARTIACRNTIRGTGIRHHAGCTSIVIEGDKAPPSSVAQNIAEACGISP